VAGPTRTRGARFGTLVYRRGHDHCAFWLGAISSTGHGKFRAGSRAQAQAEAGPAVASRIVSAHVYAYQLHHGLIAMAPWAGQAVIRHRCDGTSCENWDHLLIGTQPDNVQDYRARRGWPRLARPSDQKPHPAFVGLTPAEQAVARLVAIGSRKDLITRAPA
jgi:hypothetical protein